MDSCQGRCPATWRVWRRFWRLSWSRPSAFSSCGASHEGGPNPLRVAVEGRRGECGRRPCQTLRTPHHTCLHPCAPPPPPPLPAFAAGSRQGQRPWLLNWLVLEGGRHVQMPGAERRTNTHSGSPARCSAGGDGRGNIRKYYLIFLLAMVGGPPKLQGLIAGKCPSCGCVAS